MSIKWEINKKSKKKKITWGTHWWLFIAAKEHDLATRLRVTGALPAHSIATNQSFFSLFCPNFYFPPTNSTLSFLLPILHNEFHPSTFNIPILFLPNPLPRVRKFCCSRNCLGHSWLCAFVHMGSESVAPVVETSKSRSSPGKMNQGKVPRKIHKAEREKMKREHLNELFLDLANALDLNENNGKASILCEASRLLKDLLCQIESLKKENVTLLSESHYVTMEKNELKEENCSLETQIEKLQGEIQARVAQSKPDLNVPPHLEPLEQTNIPGQSLQLHTIEPNLQQGSAVLVVPFRPDLQASFPAPNVTEVTPKSTSVVSKPHARYPTPADSWPSQLLEKQPTSS
ncbi:Transcription factor bHLH47 [Spatholobus suberectus]|nr:Transcription factor bHLH47 [Spatholobus suberectus]